MVQVESLGLYHVLPGARALVAEFVQEEGLDAGERGWPLEALPLLARIGETSLIALPYDSVGAAGSACFEALAHAKSARLTTVVRIEEELPAESCAPLARRADAIAFELSPFDDRNPERREQAHLRRDRLARLRHAGAWVEVTTAIAATTPRAALLETALSLKAVDGAIPWHLRLVPGGEQRLREALDAGWRAGLDHVYAVDAPDHDGELTWCRVCRDVVLIERFQGRPLERLAGGARCPCCRTATAGVFAAPVSA